MALLDSVNEASSDHCGRWGTLSGFGEVFGGLCDGRVGVEERLAAVKSQVERFRGRVQRCLRDACGSAPSLGVQGASAWCVDEQGRERHTKLDGDHVDVERPELAAHHVAEDLRAGLECISIDRRS